ncbi:hypothetical protein BH10BAC3_BH10BAC3_03540 [soil metagenome]
MRIFLIAILIFFSKQLVAQIPGCTDPQATNFDAAATSNNGSCQYSSQSYSPPLIATLSNSLIEISGIIYFNNKILSLNDGGGGNKLYMLDTTTGVIVQTITIGNATNVDWEDITQDSNYVYVGDVGNNAHGNRTDLCIYKIDKNAFVAGGDFAIPSSAIEKINFHYEDQSDFSSASNNNTRFDCEAITVARGQLHLFTKNWTGNFSVHYSLPLQAGNYAAKRLDSLNTGGLLITGADAGAYDELLFTAYSKTGSCAIYLIYGYDTSNLFFNTGNKRQIQLPGVLTSGQLEAVCFVNATHGFLANEKFTQSIFTVTNKLRSFTTTQWIIDYYKNNPLLSEKGMLRYNSTTDKYEVFTGMGWDALN